MATLQSIRPFTQSLVRGLFTVLLIAALNFCLIKLAPGDVADAMAGQAGSASESYVQSIREKYGLNQPFHRQFLNYMGDLVTGDLGHSARYTAPVLDVILARLPATLTLIFASVGLAFLGGIACGAVAARRVDSWVDGAISTFALLAYATPLFWLGLMLNVIFALKLDWLPSGGYMTIGLQGGWFAKAIDSLQYMVLPVTTMAMFYLAVFTRTMRASIIEVQDMEFVRTARSKGISDARVLIRHILRNAMLPMTTSLGIQIGSVLGGAIVVETVFGWPGLGRLAYEAVLQRDIRLLLGILLVSSILVVVINVVLEWAYRWLDPRIRGNNE